MIDRLTLDTGADRETERRRDETRNSISSHVLFLPRASLRKMLGMTSDQLLVYETNNTVEPSKVPVYSTCRSPRDRMTNLYNRSTVFVVLWIRKFIGRACNIQRPREERTMRCEAESEEKQNAQGKMRTIGTLGTVLPTKTMKGVKPGT